MAVRGAVGGTCPGLLVSVRSAAEAELAAGAGVAIVDVKEPRRGALGRADLSVMAAVVGVVAGRCPVSVALGELGEEFDGRLPDGIAFAKWGLAGMGRCGNWPEVLDRASARLRGSRPVAVAYADAAPAGAPEPAEVLAAAASRGWPVLLLDTWAKDGRTLLDWVPLEELACLRDKCREARVNLAVAGSLGLVEIERLLPLRPDWVAVRGAACRKGRRDEGLDPVALGELVACVSARPESRGG